MILNLLENNRLTHSFVEKIKLYFLIAQGIVILVVHRL